MTWQQELELIRKKRDGILHARDVVEYAARNPSSALHAQFEWDNEKAADLQRITRARELIAIVHVERQPELPPIRAYVSLVDDRKKGGGYRTLSDVLAGSALRKKLVRDALRDVETFETKYRILLRLANAGGLRAGLDALKEALCAVAGNDEKQAAVNG